MMRRVSGNASSLLLLVLSCGLGIQTWLTGSVKPAWAGGALVARSGGVRLAVTKHASQLTVIVPAGPYVRGELLPVHISVRNVGAYNQLVLARCTVNNPQVQVLDGRLGIITFPPAIRPLAHPICPQSTAPLFRPGQVLRRREFVVLNGSWLRGSWRYSGAPQNGSPIGGMGQLVTPAVRLTLLSANKPHFSLQTVPRVALVVARPSGVESKLLYMDTAQCPGSSGSSAIFQQRVYEWQASDSNVVAPPCARPLRWRVVAGWVGYSVVATTYVAPASRSTSK